MTMEDSTQDVGADPLYIQEKRSSSCASKSTRHSRTTSQGTRRRSSRPHITPPPSPSDSQHSLASEVPCSPTNQLIHHFLRAFFPFHPTVNPASNTVTLPLNTGDIILVHSVHTNGWADGTMLSSGARGWLPTNYCDVYDLEQIRPLLRSCLHLFNQCKGVGHHRVGNQIAVTGVVAGVRCLLETTHCLTREAPNVRSNDRLRRQRKLLLSDLSSLVKIAKRIPDHSMYDLSIVEEIIDEMVLRTFKVVVRGVSFLDSWYDEHFNSPEGEPALYDKDSYVPPTPPAESAGLPSSIAEATTDTYVDANVNIRNSVGHGSESIVVLNSLSYLENLPPLPSSPHSAAPHVNSPGFRNECGSSLSYRSSLSHDNHEPVYALARLNLTHDILLSYLASYIGRLHMHSRSHREIHINTKQSASAAQDLLAVVEAVHARDPTAVALERAKKAMYGRVTALVNTARQVIAHADDDDDGEGVMPPDEGRKLMNCATGCVKGAGECVAKAKFVIERVGDFVLDMGTVGKVAEDISSSTEPMDEADEKSQSSTSEEKAAMERELMPPPPPPAKDKPKDKPLPLPPLPQLDTSLATLSKDDPLPPIPDSPTQRAPSSRRSSIRSLQPSLTLTTSTIVTPDEYSAAEQIRKRDAEAKAAFEKSFRIESLGGVSNSTIDSTYQSLRDSEITLVSQSSTRATSPESQSSFTPNGPSLPTSRAASVVGGSGTEVGQESDVEAPTITYAHELIFNKDGQITGGSLPALVERLTVHDSTPDAVFVATFYLTFRLFTTPIHFAEALVHRFDCVENTSRATPVRLRVYNVFKGWLESHWRKDCDTIALEIINDFAAVKLRAALPAAGKRLEELAVKVSSVDGPLVPRLVSCIGKTNTATAQYSLPDAPIASPIITKSQLSLLKASANGTASPSVLDFDPLELARQITLKESRMFCSILPEELIAQEWAKKKGSLAINVKAMSALSTDLAHLVAETILAQDDQKRRATVIKQWVKIADRCLELNNYDSLMAIMCALNTSTIVRLKKTWELVSTRTKQVLENLRAVIDVSKNHAVLRARLRNHVPPCLPFLGTYLTDLTFIDAGNPSKRPLDIPGSESKQVINFDKHVKTARVISELQRFQIPYRIIEIPELQAWIESQATRVRNSQAGDVQNLYRRSLLLEPREKQSPVTVSEAPTPATSIKDKFDFFSWTGVKSGTAASTPGI